MNTHRGCRHFAKSDATCSRTGVAVEPKGKACGRYVRGVTRSYHQRTIYMPTRQVDSERTCMKCGEYFRYAPDRCNSPRHVCNRCKLENENGYYPEHEVHL